MVVFWSHSEAVDSSLKESQELILYVGGKIIIVLPTTIGECD